MEHKFKANELFDLSVDTNAVFPLNLEFVPKKNLASKLNNSGIYFLTYKVELIYIGFADKQDVLLRMKMQLEAVTLRGTNVAFRKNSNDAVRNSDILKHFFNPSILREKGYETSPKRILFAEQHWKDFAFLNATNLRDFVFHWFPTYENIEEKCAELKNHLRPRCNNEGMLPSEYKKLL